MDKELYWVYSIALVLYYAYQWYKNAQKKQKQTPAEALPKPPARPAKPVVQSKSQPSKSMDEIFERFSTKNIQIQTKPEYDIISYENEGIQPQVQDVKYKGAAYYESVFNAGKNESVAAKPKPHAAITYLKSPNGAKNAFIYSEIFNKKYY